MDCTFLTLVFGALVLLIFYLVTKYTYWKRQGIPTAKGIVPLLGHITPVLTGKMNFGGLSYEIYKNFKDSSMVGLYKGTSPVLLIREPQLVKIVLQTNFSSFHENAIKVTPEIDPLIANNPFFTTGEAWMTGRKRMTYAFSSMRLKILFEAVKGVCKKFVDYLDRHLKSDKKYEVELKYLFSKFTGEVVANAGLGIEGHCFEEEVHPAAFDRIGRKIFRQTFLVNFVTNVLTLIPDLNKIFRTSFIPPDVSNFFKKVIEENIEIRRKQEMKRNDFLQIMIEFERTEGDQFDKESVTAHALSFYMDGLETSALTLSFIGYQLAVHPDIQQKLREEVQSVIAKHDGVLTYEAIKEMTYMDQVINESQRCHHIAGVQMKSCTEEFELQGSDGLTCRVKPGTKIFIPVFGLQLDPKYWDNPEEFDPERFNEDRKKNIEKMTFLPFGEGPRMCVGMRMALLQMKACLATLIKDYKLELSPKTQEPIQLSPNYMMSTPIGGFWVYISKL